MGMPVSHLSAIMPAAEETMWLAFYRQWPFGDMRRGMESAQIAQLIYNTNVKKDDARPLQDFMLFRETSTKPVKDLDKTILSNFTRNLKQRNK